MLKFLETVDPETVSDIKNASMIVALTAIAFSVLSWALYEPDTTLPSANANVEFVLPSHLGHDDSGMRAQTDVMPPSGKALAGMN